MLITILFYEYMTDFKKFKEESRTKEKFYSSLTVNKIVTKNMIMFLTFEINLRTMKDYHSSFIIKDSHLKCDFLLLVDVFKKIRNNSIKNYGLCSIHYLTAPALIWKRWNSNLFQILTYIIWKRYETWNFFHF